MLSEIDINNVLNMETKERLKEIIIKIQEKENIYFYKELQNLLYNFNNEIIRKKKISITKKIIDFLDQNSYVWSSKNKKFSNINNIIRIKILEFSKIDELENISLSFYNKYFSE